MQALRGRRALLTWKKLSRRRGKQANGPNPVNMQNIGATFTGLPDSDVQSCIGKHGQRFNCKFTSAWSTYTNNC
jgi:hypothetical protein